MRIQYWPVSFWTLGLHAGKLDAGLYGNGHPPSSYITKDLMIDIFGYGKLGSASIMKKKELVQ